jgi:hypothetical protein
VISCSVLCNVEASSVVISRMPLYRKCFLVWC